MSGLYDGIAAGLQFYAKESQSERERQRDLELAKQKMLMAQQMEMDLLRQKQEYAAQFPEYRHFEKTPTGKIVGFSERGDSRVLYTPDERDAALAEKQYDLTNAYKAAQTGLMTGRTRNEALLAPATRDKTYAQADASRTTANNAATRTPAQNAADVANAARSLTMAMGEEIKNDPETQMPTFMGKALSQSEIESYRGDPDADGEERNAVAQFDRAMQKRAAIKAKYDAQIQALQNSGGVQPGGLVSPGQQANPFDKFIPDPLNGF